MALNRDRLVSQRNTRGVVAVADGIVSQYLESFIAKQVDDRGLVVWYDPERVYLSAAAGLTLPNTKVACYADSFFALRMAIDELLNDSLPPRLVVYVPLDQAECHHALAELEAAGVVMRPGQQPPNRNTKLAVVARNASRPILGEDQLAEIERPGGGRQADARRPERTRR